MSHTLHPLRRQRLQRSELAVPASNPAMIEKAAESAADYVFLDLEDAVAPPEKETGPPQCHPGAERHRLGGQRQDRVGADQTGSTRITCIATLVDVMEQAGEPRSHAPLVPKVGVTADLYMVEAMVNQIEQGTGVQDPRRPRGADRDRARHGKCRGHRAIRRAARRRCISASPITRPLLRARTTNIGGLKPRLSGRPVACLDHPHGHRLPRLRAARH